MVNLPSTFMRGWLLALGVIVTISKTIKKSILFIGFYSIQIKPKGSFKVGVFVQRLILMDELGRLGIILRPKGITVVDFKMSCQNSNWPWLAPGKIFNPIRINLVSFAIYITLIG